MVQNFPGPYAVEYKYVVDGFTHKQLLNCRIDGDPAPGTPVSLINVLKADDTLVNVDLAINAWTDLVRELFQNTVDFGEYIIWKYTPLTTERQFISAGDLNKSGAGSANYTPAKQDTLTFRTAEGGILKFIFLEASGTGDDIVPLSSLSGGSVADIRDYVLGTDNWILARDTSYPIAGISWAETQNERVYKKRFRSN